MKRRELISYGLCCLTAIPLSVRCAQTNLESLKSLETTDQKGAQAKNEIAPDASDSAFRFIAVGDVGTGDRRQYAVAQSMNRWRSLSPFSTALLTGDNIYESGEIKRIHQVFERPYASLLSHGVKFHAVLGNHDVQTNQGEDEIAYAGYNMSARYYTFVRQSVQFFALDTNQIDDAGRRHRAIAWDTQLQWLKTELKRSPAPWKIVFAHHPVYSSGAHGSNRDLAKDLAPIFKEYGVQLYMNGHDHNYERTESIDGTVYITSGNGAKLRQVSKSDWTAHASTQLGFTAVDVYRDRITIKAVNLDHAVYDQADIVRSL
ncbi:MAG: metallophosphoesterase [Phormidesmis sp.]